MAQDFRRQYLDVAPHQLLPAVSPVSREMLADSFAGLFVILE